jgi:hypothetical protein
VERDTPSTPARVSRGSAETLWRRSIGTRSLGRDLGVGDATAIWFSQSLRSGEIRLIDYYEASGEGLRHYAQVLRQRGYTYGTHWAPHDIRVRELGSGRSRLETAASLGIKFQIARNVSLEDGIHAARMLLPRCWFDATKTKAGLEALQHYRRDYNARLNVSVANCQSCRNAPERTRQRGNAARPQSIWSPGLRLRRAHALRTIGRDPARETAVLEPASRTVHAAIGV